MGTHFCLLACSCPTNSCMTPTAMKAFAYMLALQSQSWFTANSRTVNNSEYYLCTLHRTRHNVDIAQAHYACLACWQSHLHLVSAEVVGVQAEVSVAIHVVNVSPHGFQRQTGCLVLGHHFSQLIHILVTPSTHADDVLCLAMLQ